MTAKRTSPSRESSAHPPGRPPLVIGLIGGVGCGKSTLADAIYERRYQQRQDTLIVDGDTVGHEIRDLPHVQEQVVAAFGDDVIGDDGLIDRQVLGTRVFGGGQQDPDSVRRGLDTLNGIMHPAMRAEFVDRIETTAAPVVLFDAAILLEAGWDDLCDEIVMLDVTDANRLARVSERGWTEEQWRLREASQMPLDGKAQAATIAVDANGDPDDAAAALLELLQESGS